jgi:hypothetical protein
MTDDDGRLPDGFEELQRFVPKWGHLTAIGERYAERQKSSFAELKAFYDAVAPRIEAILDLVDRFPFDSPLPPPEERLYRLALALGEVVQAVEVYGQPRVPYAPPHEIRVEWLDASVTPDA